MERDRRGSREVWLPLLAGLFWLWNAPAHGLVGFVFSVIPGCLLLGAGTSMLLWPGDRRISQFAALGGVVGVLFALPACLVVGLGAGLLLVVASLAGFLAAGAHSVRLEPCVEEVPEPAASLVLAAQVALDEVLLATIHLRVPLPARREQGRANAEIAAARAHFEAAGWFEKPADYHARPPPLESPEVRRARVRGIPFEHLSFESGYEPHPGEPGRERWLAYAPNRTAHAWLLRHSDGRRPWLVCLHGYMMGTPLVDLLAFRPEWLHRRLGLNLLVPVLPLHGPRKVARLSGDGFFTDALDSIHAEAQAMWDLRRLLAWARGQGAGSIGALGLSLGGYNAALLACLEADLACAIAGVPLADFSRIVYRHGPPLHIRDVQLAGVDEEGLREVLGVVSPLALTCRVPLERRYLFAAVADRIVPPDQVRDLWRHWDRPRIAWYQGAHLTFRAHPAVRRFVEEALRSCSLAA